MNNIYELLNDAHMNLEEYENQNLSDYDLRKLKKNISKEINSMNRKSLRRHIATVAACVCAVVCAGSISVMAGLLPVPDAVKNVFAIQSDKQVESANKMGTTIDVESKSNGYLITANGVIKDARHICVTYRIEKVDGSRLDKNGRECVDAKVEEFDVDGYCFGGLSDIIEQKKSAYYIEFYTIFNYGEDIDKKIDISVQNLKLWFDDADDDYAEINGTWQFEIPTDIEDSSIDIANGEVLKFGRNEGKLEELRISPMGYYISVASSETSHDNDMVRGIDSQLVLYLKNGEQIELCGGSAAEYKDGKDKVWNFTEIGTFEKLIPLEDMDKIVCGEYEFEVK